MSASIKTVPVGATAIDHGFLLIEPATLVYEPQLSECAMRACVPRELAHREELMPRLIDVAALDPDARRIAAACWDDEVGTARPPVACAWIDSDVEIDLLCAHIAEQLVGLGADGSPVFWRFYDPRVLGMTTAILDAAQILALLAPVKAWQFTWAGHRWSLAGAGSSTASSPDIRTAWPSAEQWMRLDHSNIAALVLNRLPPMSAETAQGLAGELDRIFCDVTARGVTMDADNLADYAVHCVRHGPAFEQHPVLVDAWPGLARRATAWPDVKQRMMNSDIPFAKQANRTAKAERIEA